MAQINRLTASGLAVNGDYVLADCTSGAITVTLPDANAGSLITVKKIDTTANAVTVVAAGSWTIVPSSSATLSNSQDTVSYFSDNAKWHGYGAPYTLLKASFVGTTATVNTVAASGATQTIPDVTVATFNSITLTASCTFTFPAAAAGKRFYLALIQGGSGSYTATWPSTATVIWPAATAPTLTTSVGKQDLLEFLCLDGTHWLGKSSLNY